MLSGWNPVMLMAAMGQVPLIKIWDWNIGSVTTMSGMLDNSGMSAENLNSTLIGWHNFAYSRTMGQLEVLL